MNREANTIEILVSGTVQGVYYRKYTKDLATKLDITGYVRSLDNGSVLIRGCGNEINLKEFLHKCSEGNMWSIITNIEVKPVYDSLEFNSFEIIREEWENKSVQRSSKRSFLSRIPLIQHLFF